MTFRIRHLSPADYTPVISVIDQWWNGRPMAGKLPRLFFEHFTDTSYAAERDGGLVGFLAGFISQSRPGEAYIHFVGVDPAERDRGLGRLLYEAFFQAAEARGCGTRSANWSGGTLTARSCSARSPGPCSSRPRKTGQIAPFCARNVICICQQARLSPRRAALRAKTANSNPSQPQILGDRPIRAAGP